MLKYLRVKCYIYILFSNDSAKEQRKERMERGRKERRERSKCDKILTTDDQEKEYRSLVILATFP